MLYTGNRRILAVIGCVACLVSCQKSGEAVPAPDPNCVPIPEGYYAFSDGQFSPVAELPEGAPERQTAEEAERELEASFVELGYPWLALETVDGAVFLTGTAPDRATKEKGFAAAAALLRSSAAMNAQSNVLVDRVTTGDGTSENQTPAVETTRGEVLSDCQRKLSDILDKHMIRFVPNGASLSSEGTRTLDKVTAIALECPDQGIQITVRQTRSPTGLAQVVPAVRAESVRRYLEQGGVNSGRMVVVTEAQLAEQIADDTAPDIGRRPVEINFLEN